MRRHYARVVVGCGVGPAGFGWQGDGDFAADGIARRCADFDAFDGGAEDGQVVAGLHAEIALGGDTGNDAVFVAGGFGEADVFWAHRHADRGAGDDRGRHPGAQCRVDATP